MPGLRRRALGRAAVGAHPGVGVIARAVAARADQLGIAAEREIGVLGLGADAESVVHPHGVRDGPLVGVVDDDAVVRAVAGVGGVAGLASAELAAAPGAQQARAEFGVERVHRRFRDPVGLRRVRQGLAHGREPVALRLKGGAGRKGGAALQHVANGAFVQVDAAAVVGVVPLIGIGGHAALGRHGHRMAVAPAAADQAAHGLQRDARQVRGQHRRWEMALEGGDQRRDGVDRLLAGVRGVVFAGVDDRAGGEALRVAQQLALVPVVAQRRPGILRPGLPADGAGPGGVSVILAGRASLVADHPLVIEAEVVVGRRIGHRRRRQQRQHQQRREQQGQDAPQMFHDDSSFFKTQKAPDKSKKARLDAKPCRDRPGEMPAGLSRC